jgi:two-component system, LytTR family, response regulator
MTPINTVIVDDEQGSLNDLKSNLDLLPEIKILFITTKPLEAKTFIENNEVDLLVTDLQMPNMTGLDLHKSVYDKCETIFITGFNDSAIESLGNNAIELLLKPIKPNQLIAAVEKAIVLIKNKKANQRKMNLINLYNCLTDSEKKIIYSIGIGQSPKQIAANNFIETSTVARHKENIKLKLNLENSQALNAFAIEIALIV